MLSRFAPRVGLGSVRFLSAQPALNFELPGVPALSPASSKPRPVAQVTTLPNGMRVISEETYGAVSALSLFVDAGSRFETDGNNGVSHMLEHMAFKSTAKRSHARLVRDVEDMGGVVAAQAAREYMTYSVSVLRPNVEQGIELLAETVLAPTFEVRFA